MQLTFLRHFRAPRPWRDERGIVLAVVLIVMVLLLGMGLTSLFSGYTNLLTSTNLKSATQARNIAEAGINEAIYRLSRQETRAEAIVPDLTKPNWQVEILPTGAPTSSTQVASIQDASDWEDYAANTPPVILRYKKDAAGKVIFYDPNVDSPPCNNPPFCAIQVPAASIPNNARPVIQIVATGRDDRDAERQVLAEASATVAFAAPAPLSSGINVAIGGSAFIDGVNHNHLIHITAGSGNDAIYGDKPTNSETTNSHSGSQIKDSPDDSGATGGIANITPLPNLPVPPRLSPTYNSKPRLFNMQISSAVCATSACSAWEGLTPVADKWTGVNKGYAAAVALKSCPTCVTGGARVVSTPNIPGSGVLTQGVFSWRMDNETVSIPPVTTSYPSSCSDGTSLVCWPPQYNPKFPSLQEYLRLDDVSFHNLLDKPDTTRADLDAGRPPLGFTYIEGNYTFNNSTASPDTNAFGLLYVTGDLRIDGNQTFKGLIFVEGSLTVTGSPVVLGAIMVRGASTITTTGTGGMTLLYSKKAAELGLQTAHAWRILTWEDTAIQGSVYSQ